MRKVAVIGAGITGIQAALDLSKHGIEVHLIEKEPYIGGHVAQLGRIFPTGDWSACILASKINEVLRAPGITLHTMTEVTGLEGEPGNFTLHLRKHPRFVDIDKCTGCCTCSDVCPVELYNEFDAGLGVRKAIYKPYNEAAPIAAIRDSDHCINCNLCFDACPNDAVLRNDEDGIADLSIQGICSVVVSTGYRMYDPRNEPRYRYLTMPDVITSLEFERMISPGGPTGGEVRRLSNGKIPKSIVFVQCVGSRNIAVGRNFCSAVCCMYTIKNAGLVKEKYGDSINVTILKAETRAYGKDYQEYNHRIKKTYEIKVLRCTPGSIEYGEGNRMRIVAEKVKKGFPETPIVVLEPELVVLAVGMAPSKDVESISRIMGLDRSSVDGFFCPNEQVLDPTGTPRPGIYIAGTAIAPKDINDCVNQAEAVSMKAFVDAYSD